MHNCFISLIVCLAGNFRLLLVVKACMEQSTAYDSNYTAFLKVGEFFPTTQHFLDRFSLVSFCSARFWLVSFCPVSFWLVSFCSMSFWWVNFCPVSFWLVSFCPVSFGWMSFCPVRFCPVSFCLESASGFAGRCVLQLCTVTTYR